MIEADEFYTPEDPKMRIFGSKQTLAIWRHKGIGPSYLKTGSRVKYHGADLLAFIEQCKVKTAA